MNQSHSLDASAVLGYDMPPGHIQLSQDFCQDGAGQLERLTSQPTFHPKRVVQMAGGRPWFLNTSANIFCCIDCIDLYTDIYENTYLYSMGNPR